MPWSGNNQPDSFLLQGMSFLLNEAPERQTKPPSGFPKCHDFLNNPEKDLDFVRKGMSKKIYPSKYFALFTKFPLISGILEKGLFLGMK